MYTTGLYRFDSALSTKSNSLEIHTMNSVTLHISQDLDIAEMDL